jgi:preprotein translocase SecF subunit
MAFRLRLVPVKTNIDFFKLQWITFGASALAVVVSLISVAVLGLNFGIDFKGGTTIRTESTLAVDVGVYREALGTLDVGSVTISQVFDPTFREDQHVAMIRIEAQEGEEVASPATIARIEAALVAVDPAITFPSVESVGPKVSSELIWTALLAVFAGASGIWIYVWLRFEWQFAVGTVAALIHDVVVTVGIFSILQLDFDLTIVAALLTILGYSVNDTVVIFDRLRENLMKYKTMPLQEVMNLSVNETLSRTLATSFTTLLAVGSMLALGGDVIRGFSFAIFAGIILGTYSSVYVAKNLVLFLGLDRTDKPRASGKGADHEFANIDA